MLHLLLKAMGIKVCCNLPAKAIQLQGHYLSGIQIPIELCPVSTLPRMLKSRPGQEQETYAISIKVFKK